MIASMPDTLVAGLTAIVIQIPVLSILLLCCAMCTAMLQSLLQSPELEIL